jgi:hypothetical protein
MRKNVIDPLVKDLTAAIDASVRERFRRASAAAREKDASAQAGREYVEACVQSIHFVERLDQEATGKVSEDHHHAEE